MTRKKKILNILKKDKENLKKSEKLIFLSQPKKTDEMKTIRHFPAGTKY
jgi:hypothetical protein